jgi:hypothetical protein
LSSGRVDLGVGGRKLSLFQENVMRNTSRPDWVRIDAMTDDGIDTSEIFLLTDGFFSKAKLRIPLKTFLSESSGIVSMESSQISAIP